MTFKHNKHWHWLAVLRILINCVETAWQTCCGFCGILGAADDVIAP